MIEIIHLASGQVLVGNCEADQISNPFEVFAVPPSRPGECDTRISLLPFGSLYGLLPAVHTIQLNPNLVIARMPAPQEFAARYIEFLQRHIASHFNPQP